MMNESKDSVEALGISLRQYKNVVSFVRSAVPNKFSHNESNFEGKGSSWWQKVAIFSIFSIVNFQFLILNFQFLMVNFQFLMFNS